MIQCTLKFNKHSYSTQIVTICVCVCVFKQLSTHSAIFLEMTPFHVKAIIGISLEDLFSFFNDKKILKTQEKYSLFTERYKNKIVRSEV